MRIVKVIGREILDSRGNPTVEADVHLADGTIGRAAAPSGASTGEGEALELRDKDAKRYGGKGTHKAVGNIREKIAQAIIGIEAEDQRAVDNRMKALDPKPNKGELGANATVAVSMATARAAALSQGIPLYRYLGGEDAPLLPVPLMNILNGGEHANNSLDVQEFMIVPYGAARFSEALRMGTEVFHALKEMLHIFGYPTSVGDEGGFAPSLGSNEDALKVLIKAIEAAKYEPGKQIGIALDPAASTFYRNGKYVFTKSDKSEHTSKEMVDFWVEWVERYPAIISIEDGVAENDWDGWGLLTEALGKKIQLIGDDVFVTNTETFAKGIAKGIANSILIKVNQIGTLTETREAIQMAADANYTHVVSHRSGETEDTFIADLAVATRAGQIKTGSASRTDRIAKYNQLLRIEEELGESAQFLGRKAFRQ